MFCAAPQPGSNSRTTQQRDTWTTFIIRDNLDENVHKEYTMMHRRISSFSALILTTLLLIPLGFATLRSAAHVRAQEGPRCFEETGYCIDGRIGEYWEQNGGLPVFGLPIGPQQEAMIEGQPLQVQWFERNRLELHPENAPPYDVLLGRLGVDVLEQQGRDWQTFPKEEPQDGCRYFEETQFNVCGDIFSRWQSEGLEIDGVAGYTLQENLALFGLPISPLQEEEIDGQMYQVQWFERARFELHPENAPPYNVLLGLLGNEIQSAGEPPEEPTGAPTEEPTGAPTEEPTTMPPMGENEHRILFETYRNDNWEIFMMTLNQTGDSFEPVATTNLTDNPADDRDPAWSPDGSRIAFTSTREGNENIFVMNADGSDLVRLTDHEAVDEDPAWSPDGTRIAFTSHRDGRTKVYIMNADGSDLVLPADESGSEPTWSPDGSKIAFVAGAGGGDDIFSMNVDGTERVNLTQTGGNDRHPAWSPDGTRIAFSSEREGYKNIFVMNADGSDQSRRTTDDEADEHVAWSPDSTYLVYTSEREDDNPELFIIHANGTDRVRLTVYAQGDGHPSWLFGNP
jgi:Tol biopolymer transport system component